MKKKISNTKTQNKPTKKNTKTQNKPTKNNKTESKQTKTNKTKKGGNDIRKNLLDNQKFDFKISNAK